MNKKFESNYIKTKDIEVYLKESLRIADFQLSLVEEIMNISNTCIETLNNGGKIFFCGNGGSASDAQHLAAELIGRFAKDRQPIAAIALNTDTSVMTSIGNDFGFEFIFSKQLEGIATNKDLLFCLTTSGKSKNIISALQVGKEIKMKTVSLVGNEKKYIEGLSDYVITIPSEVVGVIQQSHITIGQVICMNIENSLISK
jgi:D-sedoheptulose 7-phosphate isomerase|tara:strand:- start:52158 stop:52757 length:600 start_codon:yes stop_codon:yes gene_type:complete